MSRQETRGFHVLCHVLITKALHGGSYNSYFTVRDMRFRVLTLKAHGWHILTLFLLVKKTPFFH
jgi:hypothetical protein